MITIKKATTDNDYKEIAALANIIWHEHFTPIIGEAQVEYMLDKFQSYSVLKDITENQGYIYYMAYDDGIFCGYIGIHPEGGEIFFSKIYVEKSHRGKKISKMMINKVKSDFPSFSRLWLTVNKHNTNSIAAYKKMGFKIITEQCSDIGNGFFMDDYVMEFKAND